MMPDLAGASEELAGHQELDGVEEHDYSVPSLEGVKTSFGLL